MVAALLAVTKIMASDGTFSDELIQHFITSTTIVFFFFLLLFILKKLMLLPNPARPNLCGLPPSPPALPIIGHIHFLLKTPSLHLHKCFHALSSEYGPLIHLKFGSYPFVLVSSATLAAEIFKTHDLNFSSRPDSPLEGRLLFGDSGFVTAPYGDYWRFMKKLCVTELLSPRQLDRSRFLRREELVRFLTKLMEKGLKREAVDVGGELMTLTNNTTCRMAMSARCSTESGNEAERCRALIKESLELTAKMALANLLGPLKKLGHLALRKQARDVPARYDELLEGILKEHEERRAADHDYVNGGREACDLMDVLLEVSKNANAEMKITRGQIKAFFLDLFIAGTSTTADAMEWTMAELINHPDAFRRIREEINQQVGSRLVEEGDIPGLHYLEAVVKETLRLHPPAILAPRASHEACRIGGFDIPKGVAVAINIFSIMRDPEMWINPDEFRPERFIEQDGFLRGGGINGFVPFGGGRRKCPGSNMAFALICPTIAAMVQCFDWELADGEEMVSMEACSGFTLKLGKPLVCHPTTIFNPFPLQRSSPDFND
ncbi:unnamed protein product [Linum trigynum]|uniref:Cytochrome P450 n=2 Tax=Linum trigynum TaxID=586398 RepID=A0AAV2E1D2_9ROSI